MKRRSFLKATAATTAAAATGAFPKPALSQNRRQWRLITTWPKNLPALGTAPVDGPVDDGRHAGRVVAAILKPLQPVDQEWGGRLLAENADNAAHRTVFL